MGRRKRERKKQTEERRSAGVGGGKWHAASPGADGASVENKKKGFGYRIVACNMMIVAGSGR